MGMNIGKEVAAMRRCTAAELREKYAKVFGEETRSRHMEYLLRRIAWRMQCLEEGGLSERAKSRAAELAVDSDVRLSAPRKKAGSAPGITKVATLHISHDDRLPMPGAVITRQYKGETFMVRILPDGFEYDGEVYRTLSAVAKTITGTHWNGYHFFRLGKKGSNGNGKNEK